MVKIATEDIERVRAAVDLVEYIGNTVKLTKRGQNMMGCCPFHPDKTPSFAVSATKQVFHCFGCHESGNIFQFVQRLEGVDFAQAVITVAAFKQISLAQTSDYQAKLAEEAPFFAIHKTAAAYFVNLLQQPTAERAKRYLAQRHIGPTIIAAYQLGFGGSTSAFLQHMLSHDFDQQACIDAGLCSEDGAHLLVQDRLVFPILTAQGNVCAFGGRTLQQQHPKYLNSRQSLIFRKQELLYGAHRVQAILRGGGRLVVVEGYFDVLAMHPLTQIAAVATLGTAFTANHAQLCRQWTNQVILFFDSDKSGQKAAFHAACMLAEQQVRVRVVAAPAQADPDSFCRQHGYKALQQLLEQSKNALEYFVDRALATLPANTAADNSQQLADLLTYVAPLFHHLGQSLECELYTHRLASRLSVPAATLTHLLQRAWHQHQRRLSHPTTNPAQPDSRRQLPAPNGRNGTTSLQPHSGHPDEVAPRLWELHMLRELLLYPSLRHKLADLAKGAVTSCIALLLHELSDPQQDITQSICRHIQDPDWQKKLRQSLAMTQECLDGDDERAHRTYSDVVLMLESKQGQRELKQAIQQLHDAEAQGRNVQGLLEKIQQLTRHKRTRQTAVMTLPK